MDNTRIIVRKFFRIAAALIYFLYGIGISAVIGIVIHILIDLKCSQSVYDAWLSWGTYVYMAMALLWIIKITIHHIRWYILTSPSHTKCPKCQTKVSLTRYGEEKFLSAPVTLYVGFDQVKSKMRNANMYFLKTSNRPYLQLECPECGEKQVLCPYCHEVIPPEKVKCYYDRPSVCPHCGKYIYTPLPLQDGEGLIKVKDIAK